MEYFDIEEVEKEMHINQRLCLSCIQLENTQYSV